MRHARVEKWEVPMEFMRNPHDGFARTPPTFERSESPVPHVRSAITKRYGDHAVRAWLRFNRCRSRPLQMLAKGGNWHLGFGSRAMASQDVTGQVRSALLAALDGEGPLNDRLAAIAERTRKSHPDFAAAIERLITRLRDAGAGTAAPGVGEIMPPFMLPDERGRLFTLDELLQKGPIAVCFHRGHWCPFCKMNMLALARAHREIDAVRDHLVAITPERWRFASALKQQAGAEFPVLTDMDNGYALSLNIAIWLGPEMEGFMSERGHKLHLYQGNPSWVVPIPATFVVGTDGVITARYMNPDYRQRMSIDDLAAALKQAQ